jgi:hypothetical protein
MESEQWLHMLFIMFFLSDTRAKTLRQMRNCACAGGGGNAWNTVAHVFIMFFLSHTPGGWN